MVGLPPGIRYVIGSLPAILLPFGLVYAYTHLHLVLFNDEIPSEYLTWAYRLCLPTFYTFVVTGRDLRLSIKAYRMGGVMPPRAWAWLPGNIFGVLKFAIIGDTGYLG